MALAHTLENKTEEAYWRGDLFEKRVKAMRAWAEFLSQPTRAASVTPLRRSAKSPRPSLSIGAGTRNGKAPPKTAMVQRSTRA